MPNSNNLVSILIINYNNTKYLNRSIESCLNQSYKNIEILVYDDKSTEDISKIIKNYKKNKRIKFYKNNNVKKNIAAFDAANGYRYLFRKSRGDLIFLLDSDDYFSKKKVEKIKKIYDLNKDLSFIQNLPIMKFIDKKIYIKKSNFLLSYWPNFSPESCISFKASFGKIFFKETDKFKLYFKDLWLGFRMCSFAYFKKNNFYEINEGLTYYTNYGESKKYNKYNYNWFKRRSNSFNYINKITGKKNYFFSLDFIFTKIVIFFYSLCKF